MARRKYTYTTIGSMMTWVDDKHMVVPVVLHTKLREKAIADGTDISIFLSDPVESKPERKSVSVKKSKSKTTKKSTLKGGFNPFN